MKRSSLVTCITLMVLTACAAGPSREAMRIALDGAKVKLTFHVKNSLGEPVANANVRAAFLFLKGGAKASMFSTDTNGVCIVEGVCATQIRCQFTKEGHYQTEYEHKYLTYPTPNVKDGKWQPWNPTVEITLKEKRNPVPMYVRPIDAPIPKNEVIGFDCEKGDWVRPHGKGETSDFALYYESSVSDWLNEWKNHSNKLVLSATEDSGFAMLRKEGGQFTSAYEAMETGYAPELVLSLEMRDGKAFKETNVPADSYLMFRSRVEKDDEGKIIRSRYGKITGLQYGENTIKAGCGYVRFLYYLNPNDNDRNLEYDCANNLVNPRERINAP